MHDRHRDWVDSRGISAELAEKFGLTTTRDGSGFWLTVPYIENGKVVNHKYRMTSEKRHRMDEGSPLTLWNVDVLSSPEVLSGAPVIITEGEWDALAAIQSGLHYVVSVTNGAPASRTAEPENAKRYEWVYRHLDALDKVSTFILATDGDAAGQNLASDIIALLGAERCRFVTYPEHCKDLNDVVMHHGHQAVVQIINSARPVPIQGIYTVDDFPEKGEVTAWPVGIEPLEGMMSIVPGTLTVFTGYANMGKSTVMNSVVANLLSVNIPCIVASFETDVKPILIDSLKCCLMRCPKGDLASKDDREAMGVIRENLRIITQNVDEEDEMTLERFLEFCRIGVVRDGVKFILLDPWNELEHKRGRNETETDYISRALRAIKRFAKQYDVAFWIVAHPTKPELGSKSAPKLYSISGSANWANKADYGLTYHRPKPDENKAELIVSKVRMGLPGKKGSVFVTYDFRTSEFKEIE